MNTVDMRDEVYAAWTSIEDPYERLYYIAKKLVRDDEEATIYDLLNTVRQYVLKGWSYNEDSSFIKNIDFEIAVAKDWKV